MKKMCTDYTGVTCVNGNCPNAIDEDLHNELKCEDCFYNDQCEDCYFCNEDGQCKLGNENGTI